MSQKIALVCDWLTEGIGGGERVIKAVHEIYPKAPIYTSQYRPKKTTWLNKAEVRTGWLNYFPAKLRRFIPFLRQIYFSNLDLSSYDVVISITGAEAKYVKTGESTKHISYIHAPTQYYWGKYDQYIKDPGFGFLNPILRLGLKLFIGPLRKADFSLAQRPDVMIANSSFVKKEIKEYYKRDSTIIFPPVSVEKVSKKEKEGFVVIGRQVNWKRVDLAIEAIKKTNDNLLIVGDGPEHDKLVRMADNLNNIKFMPPIKDAKKISQVLADKKGFIFTSQEPFGIAPVEALMLGTPVIAYKDGGALDFIINDKNGLFFDKQNVESLVEAIKKFYTIKFNSKQVKESADKFSKNNFIKQIKKIVEG